MGLGRGVGATEEVVGEVARLGSLVVLGGRTARGSACRVLLSPVDVEVSGFSSQDLSTTSIWGVRTNESEAFQSCISISHVKAV